VLAVADKADAFLKKIDDLALQSRELTACLGQLILSEEPFEEECAEILLGRGADIHDARLIGLACHEKRMGALRWILTKYQIPVIPIVAGTAGMELQGFIQPVIGLLQAHDLEVVCPGNGSSSVIQTKSL
jgi:hypothetical protein